jgi:hypothetical protein
LRGALGLRRHRCHSSYCLPGDVLVASAMLQTM